MKRIITLFSLLGCLVIIANCKSKSQQPIDAAKQLFIYDVAQLKKGVDTLVQLVSEKKDHLLLKASFLRNRYLYKKTELLAEYYFPTTSKAINGAPIPEVEADNPNYPVEPTGFQVIEAMLYADPASIDYDAILVQTKTLQSAVFRLYKHATTLELTDAHLWDAIRLELFRSITLGISGFDSPEAQYSLVEAKAVLQSLINYINCYPPNQLKDDNALQKSLSNAVAFIDQPSTTFDNFNRAIFLTQHINPICKLLKKVQQKAGIRFFNEPRLLDADATTLFDSSAWNNWYFSVNLKAPVNHQQLSELGATLFYEPLLSGNQLRTCADCHKPELAFTDGLAKNKSFDGKRLIFRNTPSIYFAALQAAQFADTRVTFLEDQAKQVVENPEEMHGNLMLAAGKLKKVDKYNTLFKKAFGDTTITAFHLQSALAAYIRTQSVFNSRFDKFMQGDFAQLNAEEQNGFNLFMGKAKCGTCHFMPLFNGTVPPAYTKIETEVLGVPEKYSAPFKIDTDLGKFNIVAAEPYRYAFKTTTVRNAAKTAPYMHNGSLTTMDDVLDFYNKGGGLGLGIDLTNQTLSAEQLHLSISEIKAIKAFITSLSNQ